MSGPDNPDNTEGIAELETLVGEASGTGAMVHGAIELKAPETTPLTFDDRYRFERNLGRGGMGEVKLYWDEQIGRPVAIKTIREDRETTTDLETRFLREARTQGQLEHPAIVPVHELGRLSDGSAFFAMKEVSGATLTETLRTMQTEGSDATECYRRRLLNAFGRLCLAIDYAHQRGVSHRDLKPDNIMLGDFGEVWVLDWGMASSSGPSGPGTGVISGDDEKLTGYGDVFGTPGYAAPEQMNLVEGEVGPPADIYALGVLLFEVLTFERLHEGANLRALSWSTSTGGKLAQTDVTVEVPAELRALMDRCLVSDPTERTITPREIYDAIEAFQDGERNLELRRKLAEEQLEVARRAAYAVTESDGLDERKEALAALGRSASLSPDNPETVQLLSRILETPMSELPQEIVDAQETTQRERFRGLAPLGACLYGSLLLFWPFADIIGMKGNRSTLLFFIPVIAVSILSALVTRRDTWNPRLAACTILACNLAMAALTTFFGSLILTPVGLLSSMAIWSLLVPRALLRFSMSTAFLCILIPVGLECGGITQFYGQSGSMFTVSSDVIDMSHGLVVPFITAGTLFGMLLFCVTAFRVRRELDASERQLMVFTWHLKELFPLLHGDAPSTDESDPTAALDPQQVAWARQTVQDMPQDCEVIETAVRDGRLLGVQVCKQLGGADTEPEVDPKPS